jgi:hypothetical protein
MADLEKPSNQEEEYFAREEIEKKRKLALEQSAAMEAKRRDELKQLHFMKCPKCGMDLQSLKEGPVEVDTCFNCHGVWLDQGELEHLLKSHPGEGKWTKAVLNLFKGK